MARICTHSSPLIIPNLAQVKQNSTHSILIKSIQLIGRRFFGQI